MPSLIKTTIAELFAGKKLEHRWVATRIFKMAPRRRIGPGPEAQQRELL